MERKQQLQAVALFLFLRMANTKLDFSADGKGPVEREKTEIGKKEREGIINSIREPKELHFK